jgi:hypothetical protein
LRPSNRLVKNLTEEKETEARHRTKREAKDQDKAKYDGKVLTKTHTGKLAKGHAKRLAKDHAKRLRETHTEKLAKDHAEKKLTVGGYSYPLVEPRPVEVPHYDKSTLVQRTGTERSPVHNLDVMDNTPYSQHLKDEGAGRGVGRYEGRGVGIECDDSKEVSLRISSLDYLGVVAARLRRDAVQSRLKIDTINAIIETVKEAEEEAGKTVEEDSDLEEEEQRTRFLQRVLLDYLAVNGGEDDPQTASLQHFYNSQWYRDADAEIKKKASKSKPKKEKKK